jgi:hypothetical protein
MKPFIDACKTLSVVTPSEGFSYKTKVNQAKMINEVSKGAV